MFLNINNKINITLCGMMGSGKSSIGKLIAKKVGFNFYDIDKLIEEKEQKTISNIFRDNGEKYFRKIEEQITIDMLKNTKVILSLGGGAIANENIRSCINNYSYNIYLKVNIETLCKRIQNSKNRPLIINKDNKDLDKTLRELMEKRKKFYLNADLIINNEDEKSITIKNIIDKIKND